MHIENEYGRFGRARLLREAASETDANLDMAGLVQNTFNQYDNITRGTEGGGEHVRYEPAADMERESTDEEDDGEDLFHRHMTGPAVDTLSDAQRILEESSHTLLYARARMSSLSATMILLQTCRTHKCTSAFITELFSVLKNAILSEINTLPPTEYAASKLLRRLRLQHEDIDVCPNSCMLYRGEDKDKEFCTKQSCRAPRYKRAGSSRVPCKVLRFFPLIPRLQRIYSIPKLASLQTWHIANKSQDGLIRHAADNKQWAFVDSLDAAFTSEHQNVRLGLATDGLNPFSVKRSTWSTWPVVLINYNAPPWMSTKKHFMILSMIIPGPQSVTGSSFDVYLQPLLEELLLLWQPAGIETVDAAR